MNPRLTVLFVLLVGAPLLTALWLGLRMVESQSKAEEAEQAGQMESIAMAEMENSRNLVSDVLVGLQKKFNGIVDQPLRNREDVRSIPRNEPLVRQVFILENDGRIIFPPGLESERTEAESDFLERTDGVWRSREKFYRPAVEGVKVAGDRSGWHTWFWGEGLQLLFWKWSAEDGRVIGLDVDRSALLAALLEPIPEKTTIPGGAVQLIDASGKIFHQWGSLNEEETQPVLGSIDLAAPLAAWKLQALGSPQAYAGSGKLAKTAQIGFLSALAVGGLLTILAAAWFYRESTKTARDAERKVSFVNHVSHEFRTPLTNILLYTDLAQAEEDAGQIKSHLSVVEDEGQRLHRLVDNVLSYARSERGALKVKRQPCDADDIIRETADSFRASFADHGIELEFDLAANGQVQADPEALREISGNLLANIEKYAASGKWAKISTRMDGDTLQLTVEDRGPGLTRSQARKIFRPFYRVSNRVTDGVAGAGIGLSIVQRWARLHGGNVRCESAPDGSGVRFVVQLHAPPAH